MNVCWYSLLSKVWDKITNSYTQCIYYNCLFYFRYDKSNDNNEWKASEKEKSVNFNQCVLGGIYFFLNRGLLILQA